MTEKALHMYRNTPLKADVRDVKALQDAISAVAVDEAARRGLESWHVARALRSLLELFDGAEVMLAKPGRPLPEGAA
jgi:hypothetical protein